MPICGGGDGIRAEDVEHVPHCVYHGECDDVSPISASRKIVDSLKEAGGPEIEFFELSGR